MFYFNLLRKHGYNCNKDDFAVLKTQREKHVMMIYANTFLMCLRMEITCCYVKLLVKRLSCKIE